MMRAAEVRFENVWKRYGQTVAVRDVSFTVPAGTLCTLLGPSGCGKTTTLRMIAGLEQTSEGRVLIGGRDVTALPPNERDVSMVFQSYALFPHMGVLENVMYGLTVSRTPKAEAESRAMEALATVGLKGFEGRNPSQLSGGQQQRVALARAIVLRPSVLLFDEPLSNLDARLRRRMREEIRDLQSSLGLTGVYVTHDQAEALAISDQVIVMNNAIIAQAGTPRDLYEQPQNAFVADFVGEANRVTGLLTARDDTHGQIALGRASFHLPHRGRPTGEVPVAIRPEAVAILDADDPEAALPGVIEKASYLGTVMEYGVTTDLGTLFVVCPNVDRARRAGDAVGIGFAATRGIAILAG
ncbi:ABC transporter ATP-binding protein [Humitalea sp. 24SJ18S-53]|uniref:ABC transporter ATP-binding protein n=1 Tax=Humitalea sp. 24SJ18S-53 TaxID=3422307 RepID=UPI003D67326C